MIGSIERDTRRKVSVLGVSAVSEQLRNAQQTEDLDMTPAILLNVGIVETTETQSTQRFAES